MRIAVALSIIAWTVTSVPAAAKSAHLVCQKTGERVGGLKKTCYYECGSWEGGRQEYIYDHCPAWTFRWRLNHDSQYGPRTRRKVTG